MSYTVALMVTLVLAHVASAEIGHFEGFEDSGWAANQTDNWQNFYSEIERADSLTDGITSRTGNAHAIITNLGTAENVFGEQTLGAGGVYTRFGGYSSSFGSGFTARLDVYLDINWSEGEGLDYSVGINDSGGSHMRDYIMHIGVTDQGLLVNSSCNSDLSFNEYKLENENDKAYGTITQTGWYTMEHKFYDDAGTVSVDTSLLDSTGDSVWSATIGSSDEVATAGGHRYGWFTFCNIDGLALDNTTVVPEPTSLMLLLGAAVSGLVLTRRRRR